MKVNKNKKGTKAKVKEVHILVLWQGSENFVLELNNIEKCIEF